MSPLASNSNKTNNISPLHNTILLIGGAHSGKSEFASQLLRSDLNTTVLGTGILQDPIFERRIEFLKSYRPKHWQQFDIADDLIEIFQEAIQDQQQVLIDSINQWIATLVMRHSHSYSDDQISELVLHEIQRLASHFQYCKYSVVIVTGELGTGLSPPTAVGRLFRMLVGKANMVLAASCSHVVQMTAGIAVPIKGKPLAQFAGSETELSPVPADFSSSNKSSTG